MTVYVDNRLRRSQFGTRRTKRLADAVLETLRLDAELSVILVGEKRMRTLNRRYRGKDAPTDVLSFPQEEGERLVSPVRLLGDVVICERVAMRQAKEYGATLPQEMARLLVHGVLHLLGHDHLREADRAKMERKERQLEKKLGPLLETL